MLDAMSEFPITSVILIKNFSLKSHECFQEWKRRPFLILESINMLVWVNVPEYLAACLENESEGFG